MIKVDENRPAGPIEEVRLRGIPERQAAHEDPKWYDLDRYSVIRDPLLLAGFVLVIVGVARLNVPAAVILAGAGMMALAYLMAK